MVSNNAFGVSIGGDILNTVAGEEATMTRELIERFGEPVTIPSLISDFEALGLAAGDTVIVHSSLSAIGWVAGGAQAVVDALREVLTEDGTLVMPTHTPQYLHPDEWQNPPVPEDWYDQIFAHRPPYRPALTPSHGMGAIPECFRTYPDVTRSRHPLFSFAAWGADAGAIVGQHSYDYSLGQDSPIGRIYERGGTVLLVGVDHTVNTSLHLGEYRADIQTERISRTAPILEDGERVTITYEDIETSTDDFAEVGEAFLAEGGGVSGTVGAADSLALDQRELVDFATAWFEHNRDGQD